MMARIAGRSAEDTRQQILDAAATLISTHGTAIPVTEIADAAGVSKGGLLYHFPNKEALLKGVATELMRRFRAEVEQTATAEPEDSPGHLARAYLRVGFSHADDPTGLHAYLSLTMHLALEGGLEELAQRDAATWRAALMADGLDPVIVRIVIAATDGSNSAPLWGAVLTDHDRATLEADLIALTHPPHTLTSSPAP
ncbi:TetR/AcrR family transcriptional regulator [Microbacterium saperdae]|uniref:TetR family transcriptional regulator n=1 Tax=Microbacterium saperdae TaxID=69368 RepID=A0A543BL60_9MICO|nr:TetR/AcrR family transcriptional regulator [Microbacterium saperdae]TQL85580.1 TetR family transcriptional regulator [Microbacterium saperdae]GGM62632.1 TetR family transcriptional regulator [Microbacterium saperdae]